MPPYVQKWLRGKNTGYYLALALVVGVLLMLLGRGLANAPPGRENEAVMGAPDASDGFQAFQALPTERGLEARLEEAFAQVEGAGRVRVLVRFAPDRETEYASDTSTDESYARETDSQGGSRETRSARRQETTITITDKTGVERPLVLRESEPKIVGAVIITEGGGSVFVKDALTKAACTVLGLEANKVQILKMKGR